MSKILIVEDEESIADLEKDYLELRLQMMDRQGLIRRFSVILIW